MSQRVSFVVAARNDDYGRNFLQRMQVFSDNLLTLAGATGLNGELIVVEWNPPLDKAPLKEALTWAHTPSSFDVRFITVARHVHEGLPNSGCMPLFEYIAKNVGIRRAEGDFVIATNPDIIYSEALIRFFSESKLMQDSFYRTDRFNVSPDVPLEYDVGRRLQFCENNIVSVSRFYGMKMVGAGAKTQTWSERVSEFIRDKRPRLHNNLHTVAAGDFLLLHKKDWDRLRGFPELPTHSHIDTYMCFIAASAGLRQVVLKDNRRIYHQEHDRGEHQTRPLTDYGELTERVQKMRAEHKPWIANNEGWGLGGEQFQDESLKGHQPALREG